MQYLNKLLAFLNSRIFLILLTITFLIVTISTCSNNGELKQSLNNTSLNIDVLNDSITTTTNKYGEIQSSIGGFVARGNELAMYNKQLSDDIKKEKGKVITYSTLVFKLKQNIKDLEEEIDSMKSQYYPPIQIDDSTWNVSWELTYTYDSLNYDNYKGTTQLYMFNSNVNGLNLIALKHNKTWLTERESQIKLQWGQKWEGEKLKVFVNTSHPAFQAQLMEGAYVDLPEKKHWFNGFGVGPAINFGYDITRGQTAIVLGASLHYNIYKW